MLKEHGVEADQSSKKVNKIEINGLDAEEMLFQGKEKLGSHVTPVSITIIVVPIKDKVIVLTHFVSTEDESKSKEAVGKMVKSLKPASLACFFRGTGRVPRMNFGIFSLDVSLARENDPSKA